MAVAALKKGAVDFIEKPFAERDLLAIIERCLALDAARRLERGEREQMLVDIDAARLQGAPLQEACVIVGIGLRTYRRWKAGGDDGRPLAARPEPDRANGGWRVMRSYGGVTTFVRGKNRRGDHRLARNNLLLSSPPCQIANRCSTCAHYPPRRLRSQLSR